MALPIPSAPTPRVLSVDDVALRRGHRYATVVIDAVTHRRVDVLPDRKAATLTEWLREHPGAEIVCRDGSASYAEAIRQGAPDAVQVSDRWHLWHGLGAAVEKSVIAHGHCWRAGPPSPARAIDERTRARHTAVHELLNQGVGLLECARRLGWSLNTVKRYARAATAEQLRRPPRYGRTLVDPYRDHLRHRMAAQPGMATTRLLSTDLENSARPWRRSVTTSTSCSRSTTSPPSTGSICTPRIRSSPRSRPCDTARGSPAARLARPGSRWRSSSSRPPRTAGAR